MEKSDLPPINIQAHARFMKLVFFVMVLSVGVYAGALLVISRSAEHLSDGMKVGFEFCALASALVVFFVRFVKIARVLVPETLIPAAERLGKLRSYFIVCSVFSETVALYGFVLGFMGASLVDVAPFFVGSLVLYALCYPRLPSDLDDRQQ